MIERCETGISGFDKITQGGDWNFWI